MYYYYSDDLICSDATQAERPFEIHESGTARDSDLLESDQMYRHPESETQDRHNPSHVGQERNSAEWKILRR
jgi:hypothetical protein